MTFNSVNTLRNQPQQQTNKTMLPLATVGAYAAGLGITVGTQKPIGVATSESFARLYGNLPSDTVDIINKGAQKVLDEVTDLGKKGVKILDSVEGLGPEDKNATTFFGKIKKMVNDSNNIVQGIKNGKQAVFLADDNLVIYHKKKMAPAAFHEIGHAHNFNNSKIWKCIQKSRKTILAIPFFLMGFIAFTRNAKPEEGKELTGMQKVTNFIRNNGVGLAVVATLPLIAEEVAASVKGCKWANKVLDKNLAKKVLQFNMLGGLSYLAIGACSVLGVHVAKKIKDNAVAKQEAKTAIA